MVFNFDFPESLKQASDLMSVYGNWSADRYKKSHCLSYEWHYNPADDPENDQEQEDAGFSPPMMPPDFSMMDVHRAVIRMPEKQRRFLFAVYVPQRKHPSAQIRALGIPGKEIDIYGQKCLTMFLNCYKVMKPTKG